MCHAQKSVKCLLSQKILANFTHLTTIFALHGSVANKTIKMKHFACQQLWKFGFLLEKVPETIKKQFFKFACEDGLSKTIAQNRRVFAVFTRRFGENKRQSSACESKPGLSAVYETIKGV